MNNLPTLDSVPAGLHSLGAGDPEGSIAERFATALARINDFHLRNGADEGEYLEGTSEIVLRCKLTYDDDKLADINTTIDTKMVAITEGVIDHATAADGIVEVLVPSGSVQQLSIGHAIIDRNNAEAEAERRAEDGREQ